MNPGLPQDRDVNYPAGKPRPTRLSSAFNTFTETFGLSRMATIIVVIFISVVVIAAVFGFVWSAPPRRLVISSGPPGSSFERVAESYSNILARNGVILKILPSQGSIENLQRLSDRKYSVDVGFVQAGETNDTPGVKLYSLGSIAYQPLLIFYR